MKEDGYDKCITALKLLRDDIERLRFKNHVNAYDIGYNNAIEKILEIVDEMIESD